MPLKGSIKSPGNNLLNQLFFQITLRIKDVINLSKQQKHENHFYNFIRNINLYTNDGTTKTSRPDRA